MVKLCFFLTFFSLVSWSINFIEAPTKDLERTKEGNVKLGWGELLLKKKIVVFPATYIANTDEELQELEVLVANSWGRIHESLFQTKMSALHLSLLLSLLGLEKGDLVNIKVFSTPESKEAFFVEELLLDKRTEKTKKKSGWKFVAQEKYMEDTNVAGNIAITYSITHLTVIDCNDPQSKEDWIFSVNRENKRLKINQKVMLAISKREKK